ncbi:MAG TPA: DUF5107 domain-containing protein, partial [Candidatus Limnocylindrales bacterium]
MPVDWTIEEGADGSRTVWLSEHEPMNRLKGMVGIRLYPGRSIVEARVRLFNRTPYVQTFLWWANVAARVHDRYQSFFPPDVTYVADHAKRAMSTFPIARGVYYGVDYGARPPAEADLSWYRNIPVPTSYMAMGSEADFFGGYDHAAEAGFVHVADHSISPGKKQWTWGNDEFGHAWDRNLTDRDGPYVELMAGVYTDNQPDFSFLAPYENRSFSQAWYPIQRIGPVQQATVDAALSLRAEGRRARVGACASCDLPGARLRLIDRDGRVVAERTGDLRPGEPLLTEAELADGVLESDLRASLLAADGRELVACAAVVPESGQLPEPASAPPTPREVPTVEELYLTGLHLEQYRHATSDPEPYWREGLRRDPGDARCNTALGRWHLRRGEFRPAERHLRRAIERLTRRNPNPYDGEAYYQLGVVLRFQGRDGEAARALGKATWNAAWRAPALHLLAELSARRGDLLRALEQLDACLVANPEDTSAADLRASLLRSCGRPDEALAAAEGVLARDPLDAWALRERRLARRWLDVADGGARAEAAPRRDDVQAHLDLALDYAAAGLWTDSIGVLEPLLPATDQDPVHPLVHYYLGWLHRRSGDGERADRHARLARRMPADRCFPARLEEIAILEHAIARDPGDARALHYLGNLLYDRRRYREAIACWEHARDLDPTFPTTLRNLGIAEFNVRRRPHRAHARYEAAFAADPTDGRVLYELDQLEKRLNVAPSARLARLERHPELVDGRDDLGAEYATLLNELGRSADALAYLLGRRFHPWEGGEGLVSGQYVVARLRLGRDALARAEAAAALEQFEAALVYPPNLGEGKHLLTPDNETWLGIGDALSALGRDAEAGEAWQRASGPAPARDEPNVVTAWRAEALERLGRPAEAEGLLRDLLRAARRRRRAEVRLDYFATSLPSFLLFDDDLAARNDVDCRYLIGLARLGLGQRRAALRMLRAASELDV